MLIVWEGIGFLHWGSGAALDFAVIDGCCVIGVDGEGCIFLLCSFGIRRSCCFVLCSNIRLSFGSIGCVGLLVGVVLF